MTEIGALTDPSVLRRLLTQHGFSFSKSLGQNFLIDETVCPRMAEACGVSSDGGVLEIGPGVGTLTRELAKRAGKVISVELDDRLLPVLARTLDGRENIEIVHGDFLKLDLKELFAKFGDRPVCVCANLPYYITTPVLMRMMESGLPLQNVTVLVQKEAAQRLCAVPGSRDSGAVTLAVAYRAEAQELFDVPRTAFMPAPQVDSAAIRLTMKDVLPFERETAMFSLIRTAFSQRRKTMPNALMPLIPDKSVTVEALAALSLPSTVRPEQLTLEQWKALAENKRLIF